MQQCITRHPSAQLTLLGTRLGTKVAKAVLMSAAAGRLTPEILSEALQSSSTIRGHVQREAVKLLVVRVSLRSPQQLQWLLSLIGDCMGGRSLTGAISSLTQRSLLYQVANFGMRGSAASAITTAAVQVGLTTCTLVTTNAAFWRKGDHKMSLRQYRYELLTSLYTGMGSVAGGAAGAAVGSMLLPGVGTAFGSVLCSVGAGYMPSYLRDQRGPDDRRRQQAKALARYTPMRMRDGRDETVLMYHEELAEVPAATALSAPPSSQASAGLSHSVRRGTNTDSVGEEYGDDDDDARSASGDEMDVEGGEVVWLDFVRAAATPHGPAAAAAASEVSGDPLREDADAAAATAAAAAAPVVAVTAPPPPLPPAVVALPSQPTSATASVSSTSSWDSVGEAERADGSGVRSFLRFSPPSPRLAVTDTAHEPAMLSAVSSFADLEAEEDAAEAQHHQQQQEQQQQRHDSAVSAASARFRGYARYVTVATAEQLEKEVAAFGGEDDLMLVFAEK